MSWNDWWIYVYPLQLDHIDCNKENNYINNLRLVAPSQNQWNRKRQAKGFVLTSRGKIEGRIKVQSKTIYLGLFTEKQDARKAYLDAKKKYHKSFTFNNYLTKQGDTFWELKHLFNHRLV